MSKLDTISRRNASSHKPQNTASCKHCSNQDINSNDGDCRQKDEMNEDKCRNKCEYDYDRR